MDYQFISLRGSRKYDRTLKQMGWECPALFGYVFIGDRQPATKLQVIAALEAVDPDGFDLLMEVPKGAKRLL